MKQEIIKTYKTLHAAKIAATVYRKQAKFDHVAVFRTTASTKTGRVKKQRNGAVMTQFAVYLQARV